MISGHTPEQAAALWCPMVRTVRWECDKSGSNGKSFGDANAIGGCNSGGQEARNPLSSRCIADRCAMWRWETYYDPVDMPGHLRRAVTGYCGLANIPMQVAP